MPESWVVNASPLIVLSQIGQDRLLSSLADELIVPQAVADEILAGPASDPAQITIEAGNFNIIKTPEPGGELLAWDLGQGETAVLSMVLENPGWTAILDDALARRCARSLTVPYKGTLAVVILAKQRGFISSAASVINELRNVGYYIDDYTIAESLRKTVGEDWPP